MAKIARHVLFKGSVQGVGFRFTALNIANRYDLKGYVRNKAGGEVEFVAQGPPDDVEACIQDVKKSFKNSITDVKVEEIPLSKKYETFKITF